jgi:meso-butanediol dehydrogenase / (S,S)-butanediol dehydrogenase / diacetyl reductase
MRLQDKVALVSGAASGIGEASARTYAREGAKVVLADINEEAGERVAAEIRQANGAAAFVRTDIMKPEDIERMVAFTVETYGRIDILHNNAQVTSGGKRIGELDLAAWKRGIDGGLTSYWYASKLAVEHMLAQGGGTIVNTASVSGLAGDYGLGTYNAAKAAVVNMSRVFAIEYARKNIRCNALCPGPIGTPPMRMAEERAPQVLNPIKEAIPMGRLGTPQEMANVALFLASDEASFVTGAAFVADGGLFAHSGMPSLTGVTPGGW